MKQFFEKKVQQLKSIFSEKIIQELKSIFSKKTIQKLKSIYSKKTIGPEEVIKKYQKVKVDSGWTSGNKLNYSLKNYAKDFLETEDFAQFSLKLWELSESNERPLLVMIMGEFKTGKSTFINAILGKEVLKSDVTPATAVVTMISFGEQEKLVAHFHNGESKEYQVNMLAKLTAEGDESKKSLRSSIKYVELQLPLDLLKKITLIDTPGLNVDNELHVKATKQFMYEADMVLWVFSYGKTASRTELASISELGERLKPIAIVNRIDEIDEEEETLEDVLAEIRKRLKSSVKDVFGVSSFLANKGLKEGDQQLLNDSGWSNFSKTFEIQIVDQAQVLKKKALETKAEELVKGLSEYMQSLKKDLDHLNVKFNDKDKFESEIKQNVNLFKQGINTANKIIGDESLMDKDHIKQLIDADCNNFYRTQGYLTGLKAMNNVVLRLSDSEKILEDIEMYDQIGKDTENILKKLEIDIVKYVKSVDLHNSDIKAHEHDMEEYNNSGFFGGKPLFDWDGRAKQLDRRADALNNNLTRLNEVQSNLYTRIDFLTGRIVRQNKELHDYINKLIKKIGQEISKNNNELITINKDYEENMRNLNDRYNALEQAQDFLVYINNKILNNSYKLTKITDLKTIRPMPSRTGLIEKETQIEVKRSTLHSKVSKKKPSAKLRKKEKKAQIQVSELEIEDRIRLNNGMEYVIKNMTLSKSGKNYEITLRRVKDGKEVKKLFAYFDKYVLVDGVYRPVKGISGSAV